MVPVNCAYLAIFKVNRTSLGYCQLLSLQVQDMEEESSEEEDESATPVSAGSGRKAPPVPMPPREVQQPPPLPPTPDKVVVKKGYDPKQGAAVLPLALFCASHMCALNFILKKTGLAQSV
jgi:hypothetical protein